MGKPSYMHKKNWKGKEAKKFLDLLEHCRKLKHSNKVTLEHLTLYWFTADGYKAQAKMRGMLKKVFYTLWDNENILFGPVWLPGEPYYWCVATQPWEQRQIFDRYMRNIEGNLKRIVGDDDHPNIKGNWVGALGEPMRALLDRPILMDSAKELMLPSPSVTCSHCGANVPKGKFCSECGEKLDI